MRIEHHPSAQLISDYVIANISPGMGLAVAAHLELCPVCGMSAAAASGGIWRAEAVGGRTFEPGPDGGRVGAPETVCQLEPLVWRTMRKGVEGALAPDVSGLGECVFLLRAAPGAQIGAASVRSALLILVTAGGVDIDGRRLAAGDFLDLEETPPALAADAAAGTTLLVVAEDAPLRLRRRAP